LELSLVQALVNRAIADELGMCAHRLNATIVHDDDAVGDFQGIEAMGDDEGRAIVHEIFQGPVN
jgi:hypothetical protein